MEETKKKRETAAELGFVPPPHINAKAHAKVMERVRAMTPEEFLQLAIRAGIYTADGKLTEHYQPSPA